MTEFVASNGVTIRGKTTGYQRVQLIYSDGSNALDSDIDWLDEADLAALREFFQHERDIELERWRSKEHPEYVVYLHDDDRVRVVRESDGVSYSWNRLSVTLPYGQGCAELQFQPVAREFFAAHPEPKPFPTEQGAYNDAHGVLTMLDPNGVWRGLYGGPINPELLALPLTRLVPEVSK